MLCRESRIIEHEGRNSKCEQAMELYRRVMDDKARDHTHKNTGKMLSHLRYSIIQVRIYPLVPTRDGSLFKSLA